MILPKNEIIQGLRIVKYVFFVALCIGIFLITIRGSISLSSYLFGELYFGPLVVIGDEVSDNE